MSFWQTISDLSPWVAERLARLEPELRAELEARVDHDYLLQGGVFTKEALSAYIELKEEEARRVSTTTHPVEFELYYSC